MEAIIPNPNLFANIKVAINYYGLPFESNNNFRLDDDFIYDKDYIVQDYDGNVYIVVSRNSDFIAGKYILTMLNKLTNELVTTSEVIVPIKAFVNFFELDKYLPIAFDTYLYSFKQQVAINDNTITFNKSYFDILNVHKTAFLINLPLYYYAYSAYIFKEMHILSLLYPLLLYGQKNFDELRIITPLQNHDLQINVNDDYLPAIYKQARNKLLAEFADYMI